jgi:hypothetical protein
MVAPIYMFLGGETLPSGSGAFYLPDFDEVRVMFQACAEFFEGCTMAKLSLR